MPTRRADRVENISQLLICLSWLLCQINMSPLEIVIKGGYGTTEQS